MEIHHNGWFIRENQIRIGDLGVPLFQENSIYLCLEPFCGIAVLTVHRIIDIVYAQNGQIDRLYTCMIDLIKLD